ncbi:ParB/RepB/Spo0J family partition protein [Paraburkholderia sp. RL17-347-BIC-D]|uniref:ParB/RepB/Spo0J family partition protein n=1 Tax=Paraburkholderia sp. RL17-347-BIC-D TaxID=3031632 RepID=UPI0038B80D22
MAIGRRLLSQTENIQAKPQTTGNAGAPELGPRTSPGRLLDVQSRINQAEDRWQRAEARIAELEAQAAGQHGEEVEISSLVEVEGRRRKLSPEAYSELRKNLEKNKLATPIIYLPLPGGRREIIAGHNRVAIYRELGRSTIRGIPFEGDLRDVELAALFSNLLAPSLPDFEKYLQFVRLQEVSGLSQAEIAESAGLSTSHVSRIFAFDKLPTDAKVALSTKPGRLGSNAALKLVALAQTSEGKASVVAAVKKLVEDDDISQEQAVAMATPAKPKANQASSPVVIKSGKKKFCEVSTRSGVVGVKFFGDADGEAAKWSERISNFIREQMGTQDDDQRNP